MPRTLDYILIVGGLLVLPAGVYAQSPETYYGEPFQFSPDRTVNSLGIQVWPEDKVRFFPNPGFQFGQVITIDRAPVIIVDDAGTINTYRTWAKTVEELFNERDIILGEQDTISPPPDTELSQGLKVVVNRVEETEVNELEAIPYQTIERDDPTLEKGKTVIQSEGENGQTKLTYFVKRVNGKLSEKKLLSTEITQVKQDRVVLHGTKIVVLSSQTGRSSWTWGATASRRYSRGTKIRVTNLSNGKQIETTVGGWGPIEATGYILDLNVDAWEQIAPAGAGVINVKIEELNA